MVIELGGNDGLRGYPVSRMKQNLAKMAALVQAADATAVIAAMRIPPNYGPRYTQAFDSSFQQVAQETGAMFVPFILEQVALAEGLMQDDGIHPTAEAQPLLLDAIWTHIKQQLGVTETSSP